MYKSSKLVHGIGNNERKYPSWVDGISVREYRLWAGILSRCTEKFLVKNPSYANTTCSENFKSYSYFYEWCQEQVGFDNKDENGKSWQLDKDILIKDNKLYSEDTCVFVPQRINSLLTKRAAARGNYPLGVHGLFGRSERFCSQCSNNTGKQKRLGRFNTAQEAFQAYKTYKEALIKEVANEYKEQLDCRAYEALMNYDVNEND